MKKIVLSIAILTSVALSCKNDDLLKPNLSQRREEKILIPSSAKLINTKSLRTSYQEGYSDYEDFSKEIAKMLKNRNFRQFLKNEALKQFDGDHDILVIKHLEIFKNFDKLVKETPNLNIGFNELVKNWDDENSTLLVASRIGLNKESKALIAYDVNGKRYEIDSKIEPDKPIIVLGYNERTQIDESGILKILNFTNPKVNSTKTLKTSACSYPYRSGPANYERLKGMKFSDLSYFEQWYDFKPEIMFKIYAPSQGNNFSTVGLIVGQPFSPNRSDVNNSWWSINTPLFMWYTPNYTTTMLFEFIEIDDYGQSSTITVGLSQTFGVGTNNSAGTPNITGSVTPSIGYSYTKKGADMLVGRHPVEMLYCPPNSDDSYQFGYGTTAFYYKSGY